MSQPPIPPFDPIPYAGPAAPPPPSRRPTVVTVIAIVAIIFGSLGVLIHLCALPQYLGLEFVPNAGMHELRKDVVVLTINIAGLIVGLGLGVAQLWGGIAALSLRPGGVVLSSGMRSSASSPGSSASF